MKTLIQLVGISLFLVIGVSSHAQDIKYVRTSYTYIMGEDDTRRDARSIAFIEAKRQALERAGTYVQSVSTTSGRVLQHEELKTYTASLVSVRTLSDTVSMVSGAPAVTVEVEAAVNVDSLNKEIQRLSTNEALAKELGERQAYIEHLESTIMGLHEKIGNTQRPVDGAPVREEGVDLGPMLQELKAGQAKRAEYEAQVLKEEGKRNLEKNVNAPKVSPQMAEFARMLLRLKEAQLEYFELFDRHHKPRRRE